ncbi:MAG: metallophosphoesterase [Bacteroidaceae bacterium]|nr:metallophosphoesterase [Bacteroidaceae bacterium]
MAYSRLNLKKGDVLEAEHIEHIEDGIVESMGNPPDYVITEAKSVIDRIIAAQGNRTFTFAAITDMHYGYNDGSGKYLDGIKHACQALKYIDSRVKLDAVAVLGDYADGYPADDRNGALSDFKDINNFLNDLRFAPNMRLQGNHDYYADNFPITHRLIQAYSDNVVWGDKIGGYYYKDFEDYKLRVICPNTVENGNANLYCSTEQYRWFINSLDLSSKEDVENWQILILSHHPIDWYDTAEVYAFANIVDAYEKGVSWIGGGLECNFAGKNSAKLIGNIHGHIHNLLTAYINKGNINVTIDPTKVWRMATPDAGINRANQYGGAWADKATYNKTKNTGKDTAFVVYCIDLETNTINAVCYGAGYDRNLNYITGEITETPNEPETDEPEIPDTPDEPDEPEEIVNLLDTIGYADKTRLSSSSGTEKTEEGHVTTGYLDVSDVVVGDKFYFKGIDFRQGTYPNQGVYAAFYADKSFKTAGYINTARIQQFQYEVDASTGDLTLTCDLRQTDSAFAPYLRFSGLGTGANAIITKNQPI